MARIRIPVVALGPDGRPIAGATIAVRNRASGAAATVYAVEDPANANVLGAPQLVSDPAGEFPGWTSRGRMEATVTFPAGSGLAPKIVAWEAAPGGDQDVDQAWIADNAVSGAKIAPGQTIAYADLMDDVLSALVPIGGQLPYAGATDPAGGRFLLSEGRLIDRATAAGAAFYAVAGHSYNGGVDPGANKVRIPDKRGRGSKGADNMGTAQGAAGRLTTAAGHPNARGQNGGAETHTLVTNELAVHNHTQGRDTLVAGGGGGQFAGGPYYDQISSNAGGGAAHNNVSPYEVDNWIVRVL